MRPFCLAKMSQILSPLPSTSKAPRLEMQTIRIPSETCLETAVPQMQGSWICSRQRSQPPPERERIVGGSSHSCHSPLAISTVVPEVMTSCGKVISGEVFVGTSWLEYPSRIQRASIPSASRCLMHSPFRLSDSETERTADHRRRATGIAPVRSSGIEREARGSSECRGDETRSPPLTDLRGPVRLTVGVLSRNRSAGILAQRRISASAWFCG